MPPKTAAIPHIGRKIERIRTLKGIKQETLATKIGISQGALSKLEQSKNVDEEKLQVIADALEMSVDAIRAFDEDAILGMSNFFSHFYDNASAIINQVNPVEKLIETYDENKKLYERLLESERGKNKLLEEMIKKMDELLKKKP